MHTLGDSDEFKKVEKQFYKLLIGHDPALRQVERQRLLRKIVAHLTQAPNYNIDDVTLYNEWTSVFGSSWAEVALLKEKFAERPSFEISKLTAPLSLYGTGRLMTDFVREGFFRKEERDNHVIYSINPQWKPVG